MNNRIVRASLKDIKSQAFITGMLCLFSELIIKGIFAPEPKKIITDRDVAAEVYKVETAGGPTAVFVTTKKLSRINLIPALSCLSIAALCKIVLRKIK
jgi:hypothetical protein